MVTVKKEMIVSHPAGLPRAKASLLLIAILATASLLRSTLVQAVPAFARQTGQECVACHISFPELTPYGRIFKLSGYTIGQRQTFPLTVMAQESVTSTRNNQTVDPNTGEVSDVNPKNRQAVFTGASVFVAGKATDNLGGFIQWTYANLAADPDTGELKGHSALDNTDIRFVGKYTSAGSQEPDLFYGLTLHNNPTVQDAWNSTPAFGFPFASSPLATTPAAATLIDGGLAQQVAGLGGYFFWKKTLYGELSFYRTADGAFSALRAGQDTATSGGVARLKGYNPYWRFTYSHDWGFNSVMVGTYGMQVDKYPDNLDPTTPTDRFTDTAVDAQYQYITDPHTFTAQATYIHERQSLDATFAQGGSANSSDRLNTFKAKASYYYQRKYGATLAYQTTTGSNDEGLYTNNTPVVNSASGKPDSTAYILELDYLPLQNIRLMAQYTAYTKFNGGKTNYDGFGRNARDNDTLFFNLWVAF